MGDAVNTERFFLPAGGSAVPALLQLPAATPRATLLCCPALVEERKAGLRPLIACGDLLARHSGCAVLHIDYRGCGDAPGSFTDFLPDDWLADILGAAAYLADRFPARPAFWLGLRSGATLALEAASRPGTHPHPTGCILWAPVSGPALVRHLLQRHMVNDMLAHHQAVTGRQAIAAAWQRGDTVDLDGFDLTARLHQALLRPPVALPFDRPALLLATTAERRDADTFAARLPQLTSRLLHLPPFWNGVGLVDSADLQAATRTWLDEQTAAVPAPAALPPTVAMSADWNGESCVDLATPRGTLRGVLHRPAAPASGRRLLFLHGWAGDRQGPHRAFVLLARERAAAGDLCLRIDFGGRGTSDGASDAATIASMTADAVAAVDWLEAHHPGEAVTLLAICSGCKVAIATAAQRPAVGRLALWSAEAMGALRPAGSGRRKSWHALRAYGIKLFRPESWRKLLRGSLHAGMLGKALIRHETRSADEAATEDAVLARFTAFRGNLLFIFGGSDPAAPGVAEAYRRYAARQGIAAVIETIPGAGHSYYGRGWRERLFALTRAWLEASPPT